MYVLVLGVLVINSWKIIHCTIYAINLNCYRINIIKNYEPTIKVIRSRHLLEFQQKYNTPTVQAR